MPRPTKPAPPPLQLDTLRVVLAGIGVWAVVLVVLLVLGDRVDRMWTWTCVAAIGLGVLGIWVMRAQGQVKGPSAPHRSQGRGGPPRRGRSTTSD